MNFLLSILSHCSGSLIGMPLGGLRTYLLPDSEIIIIINAPEDESFLAPHGDLPLRVLSRSVEQGAGPTTTERSVLRAAAASSS